MDNDSNPGHRYGFGRRIYVMRVLGVALGAMCVAGSLYDDRAWTPPALWLLMLLHALAWPHAAYALMRSSRDPARMELRNGMVDAALVGFWIAAMGFDALPSVAIGTMLLLNCLMAGGMRVASKSLALMAAVCAATSAAFGFRYDPYTGRVALLACLPLLAVYPLAVGLASRRFFERLAARKRLLEQNSRFDSATGLLNRQQLLHAAELALKRFGSGGNPATLVLIDIDHFKQINDRHGHTVGDAAVAEFARLMRLCLRDTDTGGRYGGDEFGIVMADTHWPEAIVAAERLRRQVAACMLFPEGLRCTISTGLAEIHAGIADVTEWIDLADAALYEAKRRGRDCIEVARMPVPPVPAGAMP